VSDACLWRQMSENAAWAQRTLSGLRAKRCVHPISWHTSEGHWGVARGLKPQALPPYPCNRLQEVLKIIDPAAAATMEAASNHVKILENDEVSR
jgi:hypothetical protein